MKDRKTVIDHLQIIVTWAAVGKKPDYNGIEPKCCEDIEKWTLDALELLKEQEINDKALQALVDLEIMVPCDEMSDRGDWCEENCHVMNNGPTKECWRRYLTMKE
jgi:hypothetical protein